MFSFDWSWSTPGFYIHTSVNCISAFKCRGEVLPDCHLPVLCKVRECVTIGRRHSKNEDKQSLHKSPWSLGTAIIWGSDYGNISVVIAHSQVKKLIAGNPPLIASSGWYGNVHPLLVTYRQITPHFWFRHNYLRSTDLAFDCWVTRLALKSSQQ